MIKLIEMETIGNPLNGEVKKDYRLELWESSTKHPDSIYYFHDFKKTPYLPDEMQVFQWILECASRLMWPFHAKELTEYALEEVYNWK